MSTEPVAWPRGVTDPLCPEGHPLSESIDRRLLWNLEGQLSVSATTDYLHGLARDLARYLHQTCEHHWHEYAAEPDYIPAHRQCLWCNEVDWLDGAA